MKPWLHARRAALPVQVHRAAPDPKTPSCPRTCLYMQKQDDELHGTSSCSASNHLLESMATIRTGAALARDPQPDPRTLRQYHLHTWYHCAYEFDSAISQQYLSPSCARCSLVQRCQG